MSLIYFFSRLSNRLPYCCRFCLYYLFLLFYPFWVRKHGDSKGYLSQYKKDEGFSCIENNTVFENPKYDLQIVVPVYNVEKYLEDCLNSIVNQKTKYRYKIVIINDGSTDESSKILEKYQAYSNVHIINQNNQGFSGARNTGLRFLDADYVMFVDSDDLLEQSAIEVLLSTAKSYDIDIVQGDNTAFRSKIKLNGHVQLTGRCSPQKLNGFPWGKVYKATLWEKVHFPEKYNYEDTVNRLIVFNLAKTAYICNDIVYHYRINDAGITRSTVGSYKLLDTVWVTLQLHRDAQQLNLAFTKEYSEVFVNQLMFNLVRTISLKSIDISRAIFDLYCDSINWEQLELPISRLSCRALEYLKNNDFKKFYLSSLILK